MPQQLHLFQKRHRDAPHMISYRNLASGLDGMGYPVKLATFDDGTTTIGIGFRKTMSVVMTKDQVELLTRTLQSMQTEL